MPVTNPAMDILLVEDHVVNQKLAMTVLERMGHHVVLAENGRIALDKLARAHFDLVLMDMQMPVMDGLEATRHIRANEGEGHIPIIAMTANAMSGDRDRCLDAGMDDYISKPIKTSVLQEVLARWAPRQESGAEDGGFDYLEALRSSDRELVDIIAGMFMEQYPKDLQQMREALAEQNAKAVMLVAHSMRGAVALFNADPVQDLAQKIERDAKQGILSGLEGRLEQLSVELERLGAALKRL
jgi:two-component system sensor histidine kinase/response regulator